MSETFGESFPITTDNVAAMLALIGKEESNTTSPTAMVMLSNLKNNLKVLFDKMHQRHLDFALVRMGNSNQVDNNFFEHILVPKQQNVTKMLAMCQAMNTIQQSHGNRHIQIVGTDEGPQGYEFVFEVRDY